MTNDELQQFKKLLAENNQDLKEDFQNRLEVNNHQLEQNFQKRLEENNKQLRLEIREDTQTAIKAEVDPLHERMDTQYKNLSGQINAVKTELTEVKTDLSEKIGQQAHDVADILAEAVMPDIDKHEVQIEELQKAVGLRPKH